MKHIRLAALAALALAVAATPAAGEELEQLGDVEFDDAEHPMLGSDGVSAVAVLDDLLVIGSDETKALQVLRRSDADGERYRVLEESLGLDDRPDDGDAVDIEGMCRSGNIVFAIGSHSRARRRPEPDRTQKENHEQLARGPEQKRVTEVVYRIELDKAGAERQTTVMYLASALERNAILRGFLDTAGGENGIEIEGLAAGADGRLYAGFRGPVLSGNLVPVLRFGFGMPPRQPALPFVNLDGRGVRDITAAGEGFLILAGPSGDGPGSYQVYYWNGEDCLPGSDVKPDPARLKLLGEIAPPASEGGGAGGGRGARRP